ncbi:trace amine-associated receptor 13c-like [Menidia menidia]
MEERELCFPHINSSCRKPMRSKADELLTYSVLPSISLLTTILNLLVIISISHFKQLHTPTNLLLLSLAASDFLVGLLISFVLVFSDGCWYLGDHICVLYIAINSVVFTVPVGTMVLISIDRYVAICYPLHYHYKITARRVLVVNVLCWVCFVLYVSVVMWDVFLQPGRFKTCQGECVIAADDNEGIIDFVLIFVVPVSVVIVLYLRVFLVAVSQARAMRGQIRAITLKRSEAMHVRKSELKAAWILGVVVVAFLSCYFPYYCSFFGGDSFQFSLTAVPAQNWLLYFNSCLNPLIYAFCYPWFRKSVKLLLTLKILRRGSSRLNVL